MLEDACELVVDRRGKAVKKMVLNGKASNMLKEIFPYLSFYLWVVGCTMENTHCFA